MEMMARLSLFAYLIARSRFMDLPESERREKISKHRFLVQTKAVTDVEYASILNATVQEKSDIVSSVTRSPTSNSL